MRKEFPPASAILHKGSKTSGTYVVTKGRLRVFSIAPSGSEATLYFIDPGETCVLALNCLSNDLLYPAWVSSESETEVAVIPGKEVIQFLKATLPNFIKSNTNSKPDPVWCWPIPYRFSRS